MALFFVSIVALLLLQNFAIGHDLTVPGLSRMHGHVRSTRGPVSAQMRRDAVEMSKITLLLTDGNPYYFSKRLQEQFDAKYGGGWNVIAFPGRIGTASDAGTQIFVV